MAAPEPEYLRFSSFARLTRRRRAREAWQIRRFLESPLIGAKWRLDDSSAVRGTAKNKPLTLWTPV